MVKKMFKKIILIISIICCVAFLTGAIMYDQDEEAEAAYTLYSLDGRTMEVETEELKNAQLTVGWSMQLPVSVYNINNEEEKILIEDLEEYILAGWYPEPVTKLYAQDGREEYFLNSIVEAQLTVGWFRTYEEAHPAPPIDFNDVNLLARLIYAEAAANNILDKQYVGAVVMNRLRSGLWGNTLKSVIYAKGQYACTWQGKKFNSNPPEDCISIAQALLQGETYGVPENVIFQAQFKQGSGVWKKVGSHYYCYK